MSRMDLLEVNAGIVRGVAENIAAHSPEAVIIVVSNPLDEMTALTQIASGFPKQRVFGQAGVLDTARFTNNVATTLGVPVSSVITLTLGSHGDTMVPVPSACFVDGKPLADVMAADVIDELVTRTRNGGAEVVALLKTGSAYYAPSAAAARMARAVITDSGATIPACAWVDGEYGISGVYLGVETSIGAGGVKKIIERDLTPSELAGLKSRPPTRCGPSKLTSPTSSPRHTRSGAFLGPGDADCAPIGCCGRSHWGIGADSGTVRGVDWRDLARHQAGAISRAQLRSCGLTENEVRGLVRRRDLSCLLPGVYAPRPVPDSFLQRAWAAVLWSGGVLSHRSAASSVGAGGAKNACDRRSRLRDSWRRRVPHGVRLHRLGARCRRRDRVSRPADSLIRVTTIVELLRSERIPASRHRCSTAPCNEAGWARPTSPRRSSPAGVDRVTGSCVN